MDDLMKFVNQATDKEIDRAGRMYGAIKSIPEGYGVLMEEMMEVRTDYQAMCEEAEQMLAYIHEHKRYALGGGLNLLEMYARECAAECIQVAAVCKRYLDVLNREVSE